MQGNDCQLLELQTSDSFISGPAIANSVDNSTCGISYTSRAQLASAMLEYNGQTSLPNGSIFLSIVDSLEDIDPSRSFVIPPLLPYSKAGSKVGDFSCKAIIFIDTLNSAAPLIINKRKGHKTTFITEFVYLH